MIENIAFKELKADIAEIESLKAQLDELRPINKEAEKRIWQKIRLEWNFHSNNIEGNSLTFGETKAFLLHGLTAGSKPFKDHADIKGHNEAILELEDIVKKNKPINVSMIRGLHQIIFPEEDFIISMMPDGTITRRKALIGIYKQRPNHVETVTGETLFFATPEETPALMQKLVDKTKAHLDRHDLHPLLIAASFHYEFLRIHPFDDGNGRIARLIANLILMKEGLVPIIIRSKDRETYLRALNQADAGNFSEYINLFKENLIDMLKLMIRGARGESIDDDTDLDKKIKLLETQIKHEEDYLEDTYSVKAAQAAIERVIGPLIIETSVNLAKFKSLFLEVKDTLSFFDHDQDPVILEALSEVKELIPEKPLFILTLGYKLISFKKASLAFDLECVFRVIFKKLKIESEFLLFRNQGGSVHLTKDFYYHSQLTETDIKSYAKAIGEKTYTYIETLVNPPEDDIPF